MPDHSFTELRSERLVLRRLRPGDAEAIAAYRGRPAVARFQSWDAFTPEDAAQLIDEMRGRHPDTPGTWFQLAVARAADGRLVGDVGLHFVDEHQVEIGFTIAAEHQGKGYASEAVSRVLEYLFVLLGKHRVTATTDARNAEAVTLLERLGFRGEGHFIRNVWFKGEWGDEFLFALLRTEWELARPATRPPARPAEPVTVERIKPVRQEPVRDAVRMAVFVGLIAAACGVVLSQYAPLVGEWSGGRPWAKPRVGLLGGHAVVFGLLGAMIGGGLASYLREDSGARTAGVVALFAFVVVVLFVSAAVESTRLDEELNYKEGRKQP